MIFKNNEIEEEIKVGGSWGNINPFRLKTVLKFSGKSILDIGCAKGLYIKDLCERGYDAYGIDVLDYQEWKGKYQDRFKQGDITDIPFGNSSFETLLAFEVLEHISDINLGVKEMHRVAKKNVIISVPDCSFKSIFKDSRLVYSHWIDRSHVQCFTKESIKDLFEHNGFKIEYMSLINPIYPEILFLDSLRINIGVRTLKKIFLLNPLRKYRYMTILVVARVVR